MMRDEKLLHLIVILEGVEQFYPDDFDMSRWVDERVNLLELVHQKNHCNFAGCAMGWACINHKFEEMGLGLDINGNPIYTIKFEDEAELEGYPTARILEGGEQVVFSSFDAARKFFELSASEADFLFYAPTYCSDEIEDYGVDGELCGALLDRGDNANSFITIQAASIDFNDDMIKPRMVINRIKYLLSNPIP